MKLVGTGGKKKKKKTYCSFAGQWVSGKIVRNAGVCVQVTKNFDSNILLCDK